MLGPAWGFCRALRGEGFPYRRQAQFEKIRVAVAGGRGQVFDQRGERRLVDFTPGRRSFNRGLDRAQVVDLRAFSAGKRAAYGTSRQCRINVNDVWVIGRLGQGGAGSLRG